MISLLISKRFSNLRRHYRNKALASLISMLILRLTNVMPLRIKMCNMIYYSTGIRRSALTPLQLRNLKKIDNYNLYKFTLYEGEKEQYITDCSP
jgi:hypothetical protein